MGFFKQMTRGFGSGGFGGHAEKALTGKNLGPALTGIENYSIDQQKYGRGLTDEGLGGLRSLDDQMSKQLAGGGLTPELQRQFDVAGGRLTDQYARSGRSLRAALEQRRKQSGGALTTGAIAEYEKEGEVAAGEQYFDASNNLANEKAVLTYTATKDLFDRIANIRDTIRTTGLTQEQQGTMARLQSASLQMQRFFGHEEAARKWTSMFLGGMGGK